MKVSCKELRHRGWLLLGKNNFWKNFGVSAIASLIGGAAGFLGYGPAEYGKDGYFIELQRGNDPEFSSMFKGFENYGATMVTGLLQMLFAALWSLLLVFPGIIYSCATSMTFFLMHDNPELSATDALDRSKELMKGYKGQYFRLCLSFIGWAFLTIFTFGFGAVFLTAYMDATFAEFYAELLKEKGIEVKKDEETTNGNWESSEEVFEEK